MKDRRGETRARGHAAFAAQARRALGVTTEVHHLNEVPLPLIHTALGIAACALLFLVRVPALGMRSGSLASVAVAVGTAASLILYDRLVYPSDVRPGADAAALPLAAVGGFAIVLAASTSWLLRVSGAAITAVVIGGVPHIGQLELARRRTPPLRLARDLAGLVVAVPFLFAAVADSDVLAQWARTLIVAVGLGLVAFDSLRVDAIGRRACAWGAAVCTLAVAVTSVVGQSGGPGVRAAMILVVWYGFRGVSHSLAAGRRGVLLILEYLAFVVIALLALAWVAVGR